MGREEVLLPPATLAGMADGRGEAIGDAEKLLLLCGVDTPPSTGGEAARWPPAYGSLDRGNTRLPFSERLPMTGVAPEEGAPLLNAWGSFTFTEEEKG